MKCNFTQYSTFFKPNILDMKTSRDSFTQSSCLWNFTQEARSNPCLILIQLFHQISINSAMHQHPPPTKASSLLGKIAIIGIIVATRIYAEELAHEYTTIHDHLYLAPPIQLLQCWVKYYFSLDWHILLPTNVLLYL